MTRVTPDHRKSAPFKQSLRALLPSDVLEPGMRLVTDLSPSSFELPPAIAEKVRAKFAPGGIHRSGIEYHDTRTPVPEMGKNSLMEWMHADFGEKALIGRASVEAELKRKGKGTTLYHSTNGLSYAVARSVGWIQPDALCYIAQDHLKLPDFRDTGLAFFMSPDRAICSSYLDKDGSFYGHGRKIMEGIGVDLKDSDVARLLRTSVMLEIDLRTFDTQLPGVSSPFVVRTREAPNGGDLLEVIAPIMASDTGQYPAKILLAVKF